MAGYVPLEIEQYSNFYRKLTLIMPSGVAQNLVGANVLTKMSRSYYSSRSNTISTVITSGIDGEISLSMTGQETANLIPGRYVYDILLINSDGSRQRLIQGIIIVNPGVTM